MRAKRTGCLLLGSLVAAALAVPSLPVAARSAENPMHPAFRVLDALGEPVATTGGEPSVVRTCGGCHDAAFIGAHDSHAGTGARATCLDCHLAGGPLVGSPGDLDAAGMTREAHRRVHRPDTAACARCHGLVHEGPDPLLLPEDFLVPDRTAPGRTYGLTWFEGAVVSGSNRSESWLNLADRDALDFPWDVHARKVVQCVDCHFARNNPARSHLRHTALDFLAADPRRLSTAEYLKRPDHRLVAASCRGCHDAAAVHAFLPYKSWHLEVLACESCHVPTLDGPALALLDESVAREDGAPRVVVRGDAGDDGPLGGRRLVPTPPVLLPSAGHPGRTRLAPFHVTTRVRWMSGETPVPHATVREVFLDADGRMRPEAVATFDANGDGRVDDDELRIDRDGEREWVAAGLAARGVASPRLDAVVEPRAVRHGVVAGPRALSDCTACHGAGSRTRVEVVLSAGLPAGIEPRLSSVGSFVPAATLTRDVAGAWRFSAEPSRAGFYVFGAEAGSWANRLGQFLLLGVALGVAIHGGWRLATRRRRSGHHGPTERIYLYGGYERAWHWVMAGTVAALLGTGLEIHAPDRVRLLGLPLAVEVHNVLAVILVANAGLALFWHLVSDAIRHFLPRKDTFLAEVLEHVRFYSRGIFLGHPHPARAPDRKLNPLQQVTYLVLLNLLFPLQVVTGLLIWGISRWPEVALAVEGLRWVAPLHNLGSWAFAAFFVLHVYLTTTGRTVTSHLRAMVDGWDEIDRRGGEEAPHV